MKMDRKTLQAVVTFHTKMRSDSNLRAAFEAILDFEIASKIATLTTCLPDNSTAIAEAQSRIKFANSLKNHDDLVKRATQELKQLGDE